MKTCSKCGERGRITIIGNDEDLCEECKEFEEDKECEVNEEPLQRFFKGATLRDLLEYLSPKYDDYRIQVRGLRLPGEIGEIQLDPANKMLILWTKDVENIS